MLCRYLIFKGNFYYKFHSSNDVQLMYWNDMRYLNMHLFSCMWISSCASHINTLDKHSALTLSGTLCFRFKSRIVSTLSLWFDNLTPSEICVKISGISRCNAQCTMPVIVVFVIIGVVFLSIISVQCPSSLRQCHIVRIRRTCRVACRRVQSYRAISPQKKKHYHRTG